MDLHLLPGRQGRRQFRKILAVVREYACSANGLLPLHSQAHRRRMRPLYPLGLNCQLLLLCRAVRRPTVLEDVAAPQLQFLVLRRLLRAARLLCGSLLEVGLPLKDLLPVVMYLLV